MQETNTNDKEIQASYQSLRTQIVVVESEIESKEGTRRIIKKYQNRISEMLKLIQRQKKQNQTLKGDFKQLNEQLNSVLKKVQHKPKQEQHKGVDNRVDLTKKQLQNEIKKNGILRKEIEQLRYKYKYLEGDKIDGFKNDIKEKERINEDLKAQIKLFEKLDKQQKNADSYKKEQQLTQKIMQQNQQIVHMKKKIQEQKKKQDDLQKSIKTLREQILGLENKISSKPRQKSKEKNNNDSVINQQLQKLKQKFKSLQTAKKMNDKSSKQEIDTLSFKLKTTQRELAQTKQMINRKQKEGNIMLFRLKQKQRKNFSTLEPIKTARYAQEVMHSSGGLFQTRKQFRGLSRGQGIYRQFDDSAKLPIGKNYKIKRLVFTYSDEHVLSMTTDYDIYENDIIKELKQQTKTSQSFAIPSQFSNIQIVDHLFGQYEYIISMDLFCGKGIEFIRIMTSKDYLMEVGSSRSIPKCKQHSFDIASHEKPISLMGVIQNRKIGGQNRQYLVSLGLELRKKDVFVRGKSRRVESSLNRSILAKSHNDKNQ